MINFLKFRKNGDFLQFLINFLKNDNLHFLGGFIKTPKSAIFGQNGLKMALFEILGDFSKTPKSDILVIFCQNLTFCGFWSIFWAPKTQKTWRDWRIFLAKVTIFRKHRNLSTILVAVDSRVNVKKRVEKNEIQVFFRTLGSRKIINFLMFSDLCGGYFPGLSPFSTHVFSGGGIFKTRKTWRDSQSFLGNSKKLGILLNWRGQNDNWWKLALFFLLQFWRFWPISIFSQFRKFDHFLRISVFFRLFRLFGISNFCHFWPFFRFSELFEFFGLFLSFLDFLKI